MARQRLFRFGLCACCGGCVGWWIIAGWSGCVVRRGQGGCVLYLRRAWAWLVFVLCLDGCVEF